MRFHSQFSLLAFIQAQHSNTSGWLPPAPHKKEIDQDTRSRLRDSPFGMNLSKIYPLIEESRHGQYDQKNLLEEDQKVNPDSKPGRNTVLVKKK